MEHGERLLAVCGKYSWLGTTYGKAWGTLELKNDMGFEFVYTTDGEKRTWLGKFTVDDNAVGDDPTSANQAPPQRGIVYKHQDKAVGIKLTASSVQCEPSDITIAAVELLTERAECAL